MGHSLRERLPLGDHVEQLVTALGRKGYGTDGWTLVNGCSDRVAVSLTTRTGAPVVAKHYRAGGGEVAYRNMREVWRSSFGVGRRPPGLPRPIDYLPDIDVLVMERLHGRLLAGLDLSSGDLLDDAIRLVAALHRSEAEPSTRRDWTRIVRSLRRKAEDVARVAPRFTGVFRDVTEALESARGDDPELVPCHGDFSPQNVLVTSDRLALLDWDRLQLADPARDVAYMSAWRWVRSLRQGKLPDWSVLELAISAYHSVRPRACLGSRIHLHVSAGLMRIAHDIVVSSPGDRHLVPALAAEALLRLRSPRP